MLPKAIRHRLPGVAGLLLVVPLLSAEADEIVLIAAKDNTIYADNHAYSSGAGPTLFAGNIAAGFARRALLQFDLSAVPTGAVITSATLRVFVDRGAVGSSSDDLATLHRLTESWGEGSANGGTGGGGAQASPDDATWAYRFYGNPGSGVPRVPWLTLGGSFLPQASGQVELQSTGPLTFASTAAMVADVQGWLDDPAGNHGWLMRGNEVRDQVVRRFLSRSSAATGDRPQLTVAFTPPVAVPIDTPGWQTTLALALAVVAAFVGCGAAAHSRARQ